MDSIDQRLIELIEKYSHLYDKNNSDYDKIKIQNLCSNIVYCNREQDNYKIKCVIIQLKKYKNDYNTKYTYYTNYTY